MVQLVQEFFLTGCIHSSLNSNIMALIPKMPTALRVEHYKLIAMSNFVFKVITRIIVDRLGIIYSKILSENQYGFMKGRNGKDAIVGAAECFTDFHNCSYEGGMAIRIDIRKAFDTIRWDFVQVVLFCFGFSAKFISWISMIFESARISIVINGMSCRYFGCT